MNERRVLLVEDDAPQRRTLAGFLSKHHYQIAEAESAAEAESIAEKFSPNLLISDLRLGGPDGIELLEKLRENLPDLQALIVSAYGTVEDAVRAMRAGAYDVLAKPLDLKRLLVLIDKALERNQLGRENRSLRNLAQNSVALAEVIGESPQIKEVKDLAMRVAGAQSNLLILGETGTGKEVLARSIHRHSQRSDKPFVTVNCASIPENLIESELFGYEKGAFTGASKVHPGRFERADGGSLFLDELGEIPMAMQVKLLNVLQSGRFERLGGLHEISVDVRVIAATHRDLEQRVREGLFREDLFYRINVVAIEMPPLRERPDDIAILARHFLQKYADVSPRPALDFEPEVLKALRSYAFPGNVRQLENLIERAMVLSQGDLLSLHDFPLHIQSTTAQQKQDGPVEQSPAQPAPVSHSAEVTDMGLDDQVISLEKKLILQAMQANNNNKSAAARALQMSERALRYKIRKYGL